MIYDIPKENKSCIYCSCLSSNSVLCPMIPSKLLIFYKDIFLLNFIKYSLLTTVVTNKQHSLYNTLSLS